MKYLFLILLSINCFARTCDSININDENIHLEFTDFGVKSEQNVDVSEIKNIQRNIYNGKVISIKSPDLICEIIEDDIIIFEKWLLEY